LAEFVKPASFDDGGRVLEPLGLATGPWLVIRSARSYV
jgi:hypothetical protein